MDVLKLQLEMVERLANDTDITSNAWTKFHKLSNVLKFIENSELDKLASTTESLLPIIHNGIQQSIKLHEPVDVGVWFTQMMQREPSNHFKLLIQIIFQILHSTPQEYTGLFIFGPELLTALVNTMLLDSDAKILNASIMIFLSEYIEKYDDQHVINDIWLRMSQSVMIADQIPQLLVLLYDKFSQSIHNFHQNEKFATMVQIMIKSSHDREIRKSGYYLLKRVQLTLPQTKITSPWELDYKNTLCQFWTTYITTLENLEENQSHLILPSLSALKNIENASYGCDVWMNILYMRILDHNNILVRRWGLEHFLSTFTSGNIAEDVLYHFLKASNETSLYNVECYYLPTENVHKFVGGGQLSKFIEQFIAINWKSAPLHFWVHQLKGLTSKFCRQISFDQILKLGCKINALQNLDIRKSTMEIFENLLQTRIANLDLREYVRYIEAMRMVVDIDDHWRILSEKIAEYGMDGDNYLFSQEFYKVFRSKCDLCVMLMDQLSRIPKEQHGWLRFLYIFDAEITPEIANFVSANYDINLWDLKQQSSLGAIEVELMEKLVNESNERLYVRKRAVDFYVRHCLKEVDALSVELFCDSGSNATFYYLSKLLTIDNSKNMAKSPLKLVNTFLERLSKLALNREKFAEIAQNILQYCKAYLAADETERIASIMVQSNMDNIILHKYILDNEISLSTDTYVKGLLYGELTTGDARMEYIYIMNHKRCTCDAERIRRMYREFCHCLPLAERAEIIARLRRMNKELGIKKPRYFQHSFEHRLKLRIAISLLWLCLDIGCKFWNELLEPNDQLNVAYFYEWLTAETAAYDEIVQRLQQISKLTPKQQVSLIYVTNQFASKRPLTNAQLEEVAHLLLPLTMGANFSIRLYSQLTVYNMCSNSKESEFRSKWKHVQKSIEGTIGDHLVDYLKDFRMQIIAHTNKILYITNAPIDEYDAFENFEEFKSQKDIFMKKISPSNKFSAISEDKIEILTENVQRKLNPIEESLTQSDLVTYPMKNHAGFECYLVASLVDKLPNLGGIARTCEVLGIRNLVMNCRMDIEKSDFKNLSMTAENTLNIMEVRVNALEEFLLKKQSEGYTVIGAEQTARSVSFNHFKFPRKCVILLGHEKFGIPANLLNLLDYAVEIPQFGVVRSLNVHVTAALFLWEYCKQHITLKDSRDV